MIQLPGFIQYENEIKVSTINSFVVITFADDYRIFIGKTPKSFDYKEDGRTIFESFWGYANPPGVWMPQDRNIYPKWFFEDRDLKISTIKESLDLRKHKYQISSASITISNLIANGTRFSDHLFSEETGEIRELVNSKVDIYYGVEASTNIPPTDPAFGVTADLVRVYKGTIESAKMDGKQVHLNVEDESQLFFNNREIPRTTINPQNTLSESDIERPYPIVYGEVSRAPLVIQSLSPNSTDYGFLPDNIYKEDVNMNGFVGNLMVLLGDNYYNVGQTTRISGDMFLDEGADENFNQYTGAIQWEVLNNNYISMPRIFTDSDIDDTNNITYFGAKNLPAKGYIQVFDVEYLDKVTLTQKFTPSTGGGGCDYVGEDYLHSNYGNGTYRFPSDGGTIDANGKVIYVSLYPLHTWQTDEGFADYDSLNLSEGILGVLDALAQQEDPSLEDNIVWTDNGYEMAYTPMSFTELGPEYKGASSEGVSGANNYEGLHGRCWKEYLFLLYQNWHYSGSSNIVEIWDEYIDDWNERNYPTQHPDTNDDGNLEERTFRWGIVDWKVMKAVEKFIFEHTQSVNAYGTGGTMENPNSRYSWGWKACDDTSNIRYVPSSQGLPTTGGTSSNEWENVRDLELHLPQSFYLSGTITDNDNKVYPESYSIVTKGASFVGDWVMAGDYFDTVYGYNTSQGYRINGVLPTFKVEPISYAEDFDGVMEWHPNNTDYQTPWQQVMNIRCSFGWSEWPWLNYGLEYPSYVGSWADVVAPGRHQLGTMSNLAWSRLMDTKPTFSPLISYNGVYGIYCGKVTTYSFDWMNPRLEKGLRGNSAQEWYSGYLSIAFQDRIHLIATSVEYRVDSYHLPDYQQRYRAIFELESKSTTNMVKNSTQAFYAGYINFNGATTAGTTTSHFHSRVKMGMLSDSGTLGHTVFTHEHFASSDSSGQDFNIEASINTDTGFLLTNDTGNGVNNIVPSDYMFVRDPDWKNFGDKSELTLEVGMDDWGVAEHCFTHFQLNTDGLSVCRYVFVENIKDNNFFMTVQGRTDDDIGSYTGQPNSLIKKPSDILWHLMSSELGYDGDSVIGLEDARTNHGSMVYNFSLDEKMDAKKFVEDFSKQTKLFPKFDVSTGLLKFINVEDMPSMQYTVSGEDVLDIKFTRTKVSDIILKCRIIYNYDYGLGTFLSSTDAGIVSDVDDFLYNYGIKDIDSHYLELECKHITDPLTATELRNHILEVNKNLRLEMRLNLGPKYLFIEAGDVFNYSHFDKDGNPIYVDGFLPYGIDYLNTTSAIGGQERTSFFRVTSVSKKETGVQVVAEQVHRLEPSSVQYDPMTYSQLISSGVVIDMPDTETYYVGDVNMDGMVNVLDVVSMIQGIVAGSSPDELEVVVGP